MSRACDACSGSVTGAISIGGTYLCRKCAPLVEAKIDLLRSAGKTVSAPRIAASMRRQASPDYLLRDIPPALWEAVGAEAARRGCTYRDLIFDALTGLSRTEDE